MESPYFADAEKLMRRGAIYKFRPIFWLHPPLWVLRNISFAPPGQADIHKAEQLADAFRLGPQENQEEVMARAKLRYLAVLSSTREAQNKSLKTVWVAPFYTLKTENILPEPLAEIRNNRHPFFYYLPSDPRFPDSHEWYINFRQFQFLDKNFLTIGKSNLSLTPLAVKSILTRYINYIRTE